MFDSIDPVDELCRRSKQHVELLKFHAFHKAHPEVFDFIVEEIQLLIKGGWRRFSFANFWHYCRWKVKLAHGPDAVRREMNDHLAPFYGRAITVLYPEFNGLAEFRTSRADRIFGLRLEPIIKAKRVRRLQWEDGTPLELGWRPIVPHVVKHAANRKPDVHPRNNDGE